MAVVFYLTLFLWVKALDRYPKSSMVGAALLVITVIIAVGGLSG